MSRSIKQPDEFASRQEYERYCTSSEVTDDREGNDPSFDQLATKLRNLQSYRPYKRGKETINPLDDSIEHALQYAAQATKGTKFAIVYCGKCPKDKRVGEQDLATHSCNEDARMGDCLTVRVRDVVDAVLPQNGIVTRSGSSTRWINARKKCIKGGNCGCLDIRDFEADNLTEIENAIAKYLHDQHDIVTVYINAGGSSVKSMVMPRLLDTEYTFKVADGDGWHFCTLGIRYG